MSTVLTPYEMFYIECGKGWEELYQPLIEYINNYNSKNKGHSEIFIDQIKEKFGGLRFYVSFDNVDGDTAETLYKMIHDAEAESYRVCEQCGDKEDVGITISGWYSTCCRKCVKNSHVGTKWKSFKDNKVYILNENKELEECK